MRLPVKGELYDGATDLLLAEAEQLLIDRGVVELGDLMAVIAEGSATPGAENQGVMAVGLGDYGKPGNYIERQVGRWSKQYRAAETETVDAANQLMAWLPQHIPAGEQVSVVHGDYRLDNVIFHPTEPRILAVLDWELSTLGHPLADFSYHCMAWHIPPGSFRGIGGLDVASLGIPTEAEYIRRYCERTGITTPEALKADWNFYLAYNLFRLSAILQGIAKRVETGTASSAQAVKSAAGARPLAEMAWKFAQQA